MTDTTAHFAFKMSALIGLLVATITFAVIGDAAHTGEALAAFIGFAAGSRVSGPAAAAGALILAGAAGMVLSGCGASFPTIATMVIEGVEWTCVGARKGCEIFDPESRAHACRAVVQICSPH